MINVTLTPQIKDFSTIKDILTQYKQLLGIVDGSHGVAPIILRKRLTRFGSIR